MIIINVNSVKHLMGQFVLLHKDKKKSISVFNIDENPGINSEQTPDTISIILCGHFSTDS